MAVKLTQLKQMMIEGGLNESVNVVESCIGLTRKKPIKGKSRIPRPAQPSTSHKPMEANNPSTQLKLLNGEQFRNNCVISNNSVETIYKNAVEKRTSGSSSDDLDDSDEFIHALSFSNEISGAERRSIPVERRAIPAPAATSRMGPAEPQPSTSRGPGAQHVRPSPVVDQPEEISEEMIREAETHKAVLFPPKGNQFPLSQNQFQFIAQIDQDYLVVGSHVDESMQDKIVKGQYIDFSKLIPRDKVLSNEEKLELVIKNSKTYWSPVGDSITINSFARWEQVFRVYANIYTRNFPHKSGELIEYNHIIHSIAQNYVWENVYAYDKAFRMHISRHPDRSWAVILQQAWSMNLRDRIGQGNNTPNHRTNGQNSNNSTPQGAKLFDHCKRFNRGKCNLGSSCMYEHRCSYCDKFGHRVVVCRKLIFDKEKNNTYRKNNEDKRKENGNSHHGQQHHGKSN